MDLSDLKSLYSGFHIREPRGNNAFSFEKRRQKHIFVPPLIEGALADVVIGKEIVFSEIDEGVEYNPVGLAHFVCFMHGDCPVFVFDNHNHAFAFWMAAWQQGIFPAARPLVHVDQHTDMREPDTWFEYSLNAAPSLQAAFDYTNFRLNVGNFIQPALKLGLFSKVQIIDSSSGFEDPLPDQYVLDIDLDIFAPEMDYIGNQYKLDKIRGYLPKAKLITVASSPYFIDQALAIRFLRKIFNERES